MKPNNANRFVLYNAEEDCTILRLDGPRASALVFETRGEAYDYLQSLGYPDGDWTATTLSPRQWADLEHACREFERLQQGLHRVARAADCLSPPPSHPHACIDSGDFQRTPTAAKANGNNVLHTACLFLCVVCGAGAWGLWANTDGFWGGALAAFLAAESVVFGWVATKTAGG